METVKKALSLLLAALLWVQPGASAWSQVSPFEDEGGSPFEEGAADPGAGAAGAGAGSEGPGAAAGGAPEAGGFPGEEINVGAVPESVESVTREPVSPLDTRVTVRVKNAPLGTFLDTISAQAQVNFIIAKGLEARNVTAFLQDVKVREALQVLLEMEGISYERVGKTNTFTIRPRTSRAPQTVTRIYTLNYISLIDLAGAGAAAISAETTSAISSPAGDGGEGGGGGGLGAPAGGGGGTGEPAQGTASVPFLAVIKSVLSATGRVQVEPRTNSLVITDVPEVFPHVEQLIAELDKKVPQVMIEAQIVEINSDRVNELGIEWGGARGELATYVGPARLTDYPLRPGILTDTRNLGFFFPPAGSTVDTGLLSGGGDSGSSGDSGGGGATTINPLFSTGVQSDRGVFLGVFSLSQLSAILRALVQKSEARFLGKPKVLTLNNQAAVIQIQRLAAVAVQSNILSGTSGASSTTPERSTTGLTLKVTPQVNREGYITLLVQPSFTDVVASAISTPSSPSFDPISRGVSTLVRVKNGQTIVLGGLLQSKEVKVVRKVPLLGYIPLIGWLFTSTSRTRQNTDLVMFITPTIVSD